MSLTIFTGCSYTAGTGLSLEQLDPELWVNKLHTNNSYLKDTELVNLGKPGGTNFEIFITSIESLFKYRPKFMFCEWTNYPRHNVLLSVETYSAEAIFIANSDCHEHKLHNTTYTTSYLNNIRDRFLALHHPHQDILHIVKYVNALINVAKTTDTKIFFINGLCHWDNNFFRIQENNIPGDYTNYTQAILDCDTRDDSEIFEIYNKIHTEYQNAGGIHEDYWLNLYSSMRSNLMDVGNDNLHPGMQSNTLYSNHFNEALNAKLTQS